MGWTFTEITEEEANERFTGKGGTGLYSKYIKGFKDAGVARCNPLPDFPNKKAATVASGIKTAIEREGFNMTVITGTHDGVQEVLVKNNDLC